MLQSIIIHHGDIVDVGHSERDDVVVIRIINVHPSDFQSDVRTAGTDGTLDKRKNRQFIVNRYTVL